MNVFGMGTPLTADGFTLGKVFGSKGPSPLSTGHLSIKTDELSSLLGQLQHLKQENDLLKEQLAEARSHLVNK